MGCWGLFVYAASGGAYACKFFKVKKMKRKTMKSKYLVCLERWLAERFSLKTLYFFGYFIYALGCIVNYYIHNVYVNITMCVTCK